VIPSVLLSALLALGHGMTVARAQTVAECIAPVVTTESEAAYLVAIGEHESKFDERIQRGECKPWECGGMVWVRGVRVHRAQSFWQLEIPGADHLLGMQNCSLAANAALVKARQCRAARPEYVFSCYAGHPGEFKGRAARVWTYLRSLETIRSELKRLGVTD
jgi:hypothetical protein